MAIELPEAVTLARQMNDELAGKMIERAQLSDACASLIKQGFINLHTVSVAKGIVESVTSKGKWIYVQLEPDMTLLFALETGGKLLYHASGESWPAQFHLRLDLSDGSALTEHIVGWGWAKAVKQAELELQKYPGKLGLSPVGEEFTFRRFCDLLDQASKKNIKYVLLQQDQIAGIGNGYAQEILFKAKIHPARKVADIDRKERLALHRTIKQVIRKAVRLGGRASEYDLYGNPGRYKPVLGAEMRGKPCPVCGAAIEKVAVGSASYVCPSCQT